MVFVVAEIGVNWEGDYELVKHMISQAKKCGCDAVKFQSFNKKNIEKHPEITRLLKTTITERNVKKIDEISESIGIEWFSTPMYPDAVDFLTDYVKKFKIRNFDSASLIQNKSNEIFEKILETKKDIIISSNQNPKTSVYYENNNISWLYVVPKYPCEIEEVNFTNFQDFDGYSNHCINPIVPITSAALNAKIIEIHVTADKLKPYIDNPVSFDFNQVKFIVESIRNIEKIKK